jgi:thymidine kinase
MPGYLELILGPMFSGKTTKLLEIYKQNVFCEIETTVINHAVDTRYHESMLSTHDKRMIPCIQLNHFSDLDDSQKSMIDKSHVILINEGQFFEDIVAFVKEMLQSSKMIYIAGLDGDFERKKFGQLLDLIPLCDKVTKLNSLCSCCKNGTPGIFSMRLTDETQQTLVGAENYIPVCRVCYEHKCKKILS